MFLSLLPVAGSPGMADEGARPGGTGVSGDGSLGLTAAHRAILLDDPTAAIAALRAVAGDGGDIDAVDAFGNSPLQVAVLTSSRPVVAALLKAGAAVDRRGFGGGTPLFRAVEAGRFAIVADLLAAGADAASVDDAGVGVRDLAALSAVPEIRQAFSPEVEELALEAESIVARLMAEARLGGGVLAAAESQLGKLGKAALRPLLRILEDASQPMANRRRAAWLLGRLERIEAAPPLLDFLRHGDRRLARDVATALKHLAPEPYAMELCRYLIEVNPQNHELRWTIYEALAAAGNPETLPFLMDAQDGEVHPGCRERATMAINEIFGSRVGADRRAQIRWIRANRPSWLEYFRDQTTTHPVYKKIVYFFIGGIALSAGLVWFLFTRI